MNKSDQIDALAAALVAAQGELGAVAFDATNPFLKNRYASLGALIEAARPVLAKHKLGLVQLCSTSDVGVSVETVLVHAGGQFISERCSLTLGEEKGKSAAQVAGSVITYLRRYSYASLLGLYGEEDTDGNAPQASRTAQPAKTTIPPQATRSEPAQVNTEAPKTAPGPAAKPKEAKAPIVATAATRTWMLKQLAGIDARTLKEFAENQAILLPNETLEEWPLNQVPTSREGLAKLIQQIQDFQCPPPPPVDAMPATPPTVSLEPFWGVICPIPRAGMKRDDYLLAPDTIQSLYASAKAGDATARARLFGLASDWKPEPREFNGKTIQPTEHEHTFRAALDQFMAWRAARPVTPKPTEQPTP